MWDPPEEQQLSKKLSTPDHGERSYYYRIPATVLGVVGKVQEAGPSGALASEYLAIAQFGQIVSLPVHLSSLNSQIKLTFVAATGALTTLTVASKAIALETPTQLGEAAGTVLGAIEARRKARSEEQDELNRLKREGDLLEQRKRIKALEKELAGP